MAVNLKNSETIDKANLKKQQAIQATNAWFYSIYVFKQRA